MSDLPAEIKVWFSRYPIDYMGTWATTRYPAEAVTYVPKADAEAAVALALEEAADLHAKLWRETSAYKESQIRALAPASGVAKLAALLRAERDHWKLMLEKAEECLALANSTKNVIASERDLLAAELTAANAREAGLRNFVEDFAAAKIDALRFPRPLSPEDEPDPVVDAEEVWAWQADARAALAQASTEGGK